MQLPDLVIGDYSLKAYRSLRAQVPNRICFSTTHAQALKENVGKYPYKFSIPFWHSAGPEFFQATGIRLWSSNGHFWSGLTEDQEKVVREWMARQGTLVFLKDFFSGSAALGERTVQQTETELGLQFTAAKYEGNAKAIDALVKRTLRALESLVTFPKRGIVSCPPPRPGKEFDLPTHIAEQVAKSSGLRFLRLGDWLGEKGELKSAKLEDKWVYLEGIGFRVNPAIAGTKEPVILLDDIYQSGTTLNFLRSSMAQVGVKDAFAISMVKAASDTDNQR